MESLDTKAILDSLTTEVVDGVEYVRLPKVQFIALLELNKKQAAQIEQLTAKVAELEEKLRTNSGNSSTPPSQDRPWSKPVGKGPRGKRRKRGGQKGHKGHHRELLAIEDVDEVVHCELILCSFCGGPIIKDQGKPVRQQQFEVPHVEPKVTEYKRETGVCDLCSKRQLAPLPNGVPEGILGCRALAMIGTLSGGYRLSKRLIRDLLDDAFNLRVSLGTVSKADERVSSALGPAHTEGLERLQNSGVVHADETGHRNQGKRAWVWLGTTQEITVFFVRWNRSKAVAMELLGEGFQGILISDRYCAYQWVDTVRRQICWAHLARDFEKIREREGDAAEIGNQLIIWTRCVFAQWHLFLNGALNRAEFQEVMVHIQDMVEYWLEIGSDLEKDEKTAGTCRAILKLKVALWTFLKVEGVVPTNNAAEQRIRHYVVWRKNSFGSQSTRGDTFLERILTIVGSLRLQGRNILDFVTATLQASLGDGSTPSLLPAPPL